jgi:hypothetical protein
VSDEIKPPTEPAEPEKPCEHCGKIHKHEPETPETLAEQATDVLKSWTQGIRSGDLSVRNKH